MLKRSQFQSYHQGPGQIDEVYILDVEGQRQVLIAHHMRREFAEAQVGSFVDYVRLSGFTPAD